jgi:glyoxylase-like metal-dependent hydrolase (beta-lactamase superfamily II)
MRFTGLSHYLESLEKIERLADDKKINLALPGHEYEIPAILKRISEIKEHHRQRNLKVLEICKSPKTISQISFELFGRKSGYEIILALEEAGAHVEYLWERGLLKIANPADIERGDRTIKWLCS